MKDICFRNRETVAHPMGCGRKQGNNGKENMHLILYGSKPEHNGKANIRLMGCGIKS